MKKSKKKTFFEQILNQIPFLKKKSFYTTYKEKKD